MFFEFWIMKSDRFFKDLQTITTRTAKNSQNRTKILQQKMNPKSTFKEMRVKWKLFKDLLNCIRFQPLEAVTEKLFENMKSFQIQGCLGPALKALGPWPSAPWALNCQKMVIAICRQFSMFLILNSKLLPIVEGNSNHDNQNSQNGKNRTKILQTQIKPRTTFKEMKVKLKPFKALLNCRHFQPLQASTKRLLDGLG